MSGRKRIRKNYYKNSGAKRRAEIVRRLMLFIKMTAGIGFVFFASFIFILSHDFLTQCDYFKAKSLIIQGTHRLSKKEIMKMAQMYPGTNILAQNLSIVRKRLMACPWIEDARVCRELPSKISIRIEEQQPLAILDFGRKFLINTKGEIFKELESKDPHDLPQVTGLKFSDLDLGPGRESLPFKAVVSVLQLGKKTGSVIPNRLIKKIHVDREMGLTIYPVKNIKLVKMGYSDYSGKFERLKNILSYLRKKDGFLNIKSIDVNNLDRIVVCPVKVTTSAIDRKEA